MRAIRVGPKLVVTVAGVVAAGGGAGVAVSAIPSPDGTIGAGYKQATASLRAGEMRASGSPSCAAGEKPLTWSQRGPVGPAGPQGQPGASPCTFGQLLNCGSELPAGQTVTVAFDGVDAF